MEEKFPDLTSSSVYSEVHACVPVDICEQMGTHKFNKFFYCLSGFSDHLSSHVVL